MNRYPLSWPEGWKRTQAASRKSAKFGRASRHNNAGWTPGRALTVAEATGRVLGELQRFGARSPDTIISTNLVVRQDGLPRSDQRAPADPGVAVYWRRREDKAHKVMAIDIYDTVADNLAAIAASLDALRAIERHGGAKILERAFMGFIALPAPGQETGRSWQKVLELDDEVDLEVARARYRRLCSERHPDRGGSHEAMSELNRAWEQAQAALA